MRKITPHLWFDKEAKEAAGFYASLFPDSNVTNITTIHDTPSGDCEVVSFELSGQPFMAISAGPFFKFNPSVSFHFKCGTKDEVDTLWEKLAKGGTVLMELGEYPFSERYGWIQDKYGLSWQLIFVGESEIKQKILPVLLFVGNVCGKAVNQHRELTRHRQPRLTQQIVIILHKYQQLTTIKDGSSLDAD
jgi:predicted 3-demethylubiquinone-9 3-methyltransferase (glyoxalase superfamily)